MDVAGVVAVGGRAHLLLLLLHAGGHEVNFDSVVSLIHWETRGSRMVE